MFYMLKRSTPQKEIGEVVTAMTGSLRQWFSSTDIYTAVENYPISNTQGKFVRTNRVYNIADYPELYAKIGSVGAYIFTPRTTAHSSETYSLAYGNGLFVYGGFVGIMGTSTDGVTWTSRTSGTASNINTMTYGNGLFVAAGSGGYIGTSTNGINWTNRTPPVAGMTSYAIGYGNGIYVLSSTADITTRLRISTSTDGITWTNTYSDDSSGRYISISYANGIFVLGGLNGAILASYNNGVNWTNKSPGDSNILGGDVYSTYGNGLYVIAGNYGQVLTSTDMVTLTSLGYKYSQALFFYDMIYQNGNFVLVGTNRITMSKDVNNWYTSNVANSHTIKKIAYGNDRYVYVALLSGGAGTSANLTPEYSTIYNPSTQFYVPPFTAGSRNYTLPNYASNTSPVYVTYVRAK